MIHHLLSAAAALVKAKSGAAVLLSFFSGFLLSFTPCFLPLVPVILGMLGLNASSPRKESLISLLFFVLGLSAVYTLLGISSAALGLMFGRISEHFITQIVVGNILLFFALALLGVFPVPFLNLEAKRGSSWGGAFLLGGVGALSAGGCTLPVLGSILMLVALQHDFVFGGILLFSFSLGVASVFFLAAAGADVVLRSRRKGAYSQRAKRALALLLLAAAEYFFFRGGLLR